MFSQPRSVIILIFIGIVFLIAGFVLILMPIFSVVPAYFLLAIGVISLILAGCFARK